jgi:hypothetical protein
MLNTLRLSLDSIVIQSEGNIVSDMNGEKVMMSIQKGKYYNLGSVGGSIWEGIQSQISVGELIKALVNEYEVDYSDCQEQVMSFLGLLYKEDLIKVG